MYSVLKTVLLIKSFSIKKTNKNNNIEYSTDKTAFSNKYDVERYIKK